jgi:hypothetical protein
MGCTSCGGAAAQAASVASPYTVKLPDGTTVTVKNKAEERVERDKAWVRMRAAARSGGYTVTR